MEQLENDDEKTFLDDVEHIEIDDLFAEFEREDLQWEKKHPIRANIRKFFDNHFPKGIAGKRAYYAIQKPLEIFHYGGNEIKHAWQRVRRGYDDTASWHIGYYLAEILPPILKQLKENGHGVPLSMYTEENPFLISEKQLGSIDEDGNYIETEEDKAAKEKWNKILDELIEGFESYIKYDEDYSAKVPREENEHYKKFQRALDLLKEYYEDLWD